MMVDDGSISFSGSGGSDSDAHSNATGSAESTSEDISNIEAKRVQGLAKSETKIIKVWRVIVIITLLVAGATVSVFTFNFLRSEETDDYVDSYRLFSNTIRDITLFRTNNIYQALLGLGESMTAYAGRYNETFPFVTPTLFEVSASHARSQSGIEAIYHLPFVSGNERERWEKYSVEEFDGWFEESQIKTSTRFEHFRELLSDQKQEARIVRSDILDTTSFETTDISPFIFEQDPGGVLVPAADDGDFYTPVWLQSPPPFKPIYINFNFASLPYLSQIEAMKAHREMVFSPFIDATRNLGAGFTKEDHDKFHDRFVERHGNQTTGTRPHAIVITPIYAEMGDSDSPIVGAFMGIVAFDVYMSELLPDGINGIHAVLHNSCNESHTYELTGGKAGYLGVGDWHNTKYNDKAVTMDFLRPTNSTLESGSGGHCLYQITTYPTETFEKGYHSWVPVIFTSVVVATFAFMILTFSVYDRFVKRRNDKVVDAAVKSSTIVSSLFPSNVRDRLYAQAEPKKQVGGGTHTLLKTFLNDGPTRDSDNVPETGEAGVYKTKPIAELFPETTIMFADIAGFTAWSSSREPAQVFTLLETLYHSFDDIAKKRRVFKVETVGDCYVAVAGLPDPRRDQMMIQTKKLEVTLGPDTGDLSLRIGLHSGPVTAGVLRGERSRFQLFGDTMNTASRMESTGVRDHIQVSQETADLLIAAGKSDWIVPREEKVTAKGKGEMTTYWVSQGPSMKSGASRTGSSTDHCSLSDLHVAPTGLEDRAATMVNGDKGSRLVEWNVDVMTKLLKQIMAKNEVMENPTEITIDSPGWARDTDNGKTVLDEVKETIALPPFDSKMARLRKVAEDLELDVAVRSQLHQFISNVAGMYHDNPFHNFEHASHVAMSVTKLLARIVAPTAVFDEERRSKRGSSVASKLHDHTYGITSDPLTQFACVISALIHDVDHPGVPNSQLIKENSKVAAFYKNKSVAEQNSVDLAWDLLQDESFSALRSAIHQTQEDRERFRELVVNSVMATDIMDKDLKALRNGRWERAFSEKCRVHDQQETVNRKATIVIEHIIQASDVAHTMQHWHVYRKWNERLFFEMFKAYAAGRATTDPSENWYKGEIGFFDFYIIPLAKKLKECGVFGVSSDEYLAYAMKNREEWESRGQELVEEMTEAVHAEYGDLLDAVAREEDS